MTNSRFHQFLLEVQSLAETADAKFEPFDEIKNTIVLSGEIIDRDTLEKINEIGMRHGFLVLAQNLSVMNRDME